MTGASDQQAQSKMLLETQDFQWDPNAPPPEGVVVDNLRRRGIDVLRIVLTGSNPSSRGFLAKFWLGGNKAGPVTLTVVDQQLRIETKEGSRTSEKVVPFGDVQSVRVKQAASGAGQCVEIESKSGKIAVGRGLSDVALYWLRDRLLLETAGLVWKPLFNVGRRTTRKTSNPDNDVYLTWPKGPNQLIELFLEAAPEQASAMQSAIEQGDWHVTRQHAHWLKSSCAAVGAAHLSELCQRLEIDLDTGDTSRIAIISAHFAQEFKKVVSILSRLNPKSDEADATTEPPPETKPVPAVDAPLGGLRVLLVEDSIVNQEVARDCLEEAGCIVTVAADGRTALELCDATRFDMILMDCQMPGMDGFDTTRLIRNREARAMVAHTPIIALTANALRGDRDLCIAAGMNDYVSKPFAPQEIIDAMLKWLPEQRSVA